MTDLLQDDRRGAEISDDGQYRYRLRRTWNVDLPTATFIMLNPSTADGTEDDQTIRKCIGYAKTWGYGEIVVGNLFALRSKDPHVLKPHPDPVGPENDRWLKEIVDDDPLVVAAWGNNGDLDYRGRRVAAMLDVQLYSPEVTNQGQPAHPARLSGDLDPSPFAYDDPIRFATISGGRSKGVLHDRRDCHVIAEKDDSEVVWRPRSFFDPDQDDCGYCAGGGPT